MKKNRAQLSRRKWAILFAFIFSFSSCGAPVFSHAQSIMQDTQEVVRARVLSIEEERQGTVAGTSLPATFQTLTAEILEGEKKGEVVRIENDYLSLKEGERFFLLHTVRGDTGESMYAVNDPDRLPTLAFFTLLFLVCVFVFGGMQGVRGLVALIVSLVLIIYVLLPGILAGYSPLLVAIGASSLIILIGSYVTHGFNRTTTSAVIGMIVTVIITGILAYAAVHFAQLTGFDSEEAMYLNFNTRGAIDLARLLLAGVMIGLLGVLYDVAIEQAISVEELKNIGPHLSRSYIYRRALRIGREHVGALVNTLAIAYVGSSLPLLLLVLSAETGSLLVLANREVFAAEIIRTLIGSIGLVIAVPITTLISTLMLVKPSVSDSATRALEEEKAEHIHHHH